MNIKDFIIGLFTGIIIFGIINSANNQTTTLFSDNKEIQEISSTSSDSNYKSVEIIKIKEECTDCPGRIHEVVVYK